MSANNLLGQVCNVLYFLLHFPLHDAKADLRKLLPCYPGACYLVSEISITMSGHIITWTVTCVCACLCVCVGGGGHELPKHFQVIVAALYNNGHLGNHMSDRYRTNTSVMRIVPAGE